MILKVLFLVSLCLVAVSFVCNIASISTNTPSVYGQRVSASMNYGIDDDPEPQGDPVIPPDNWP